MTRLVVATWILSALSVSILNFSSSADATDAVIEGKKESAVDLAARLFRDECSAFSFVDRGQGNPSSETSLPNSRPFSPQEAATPARFAVILSGSSRTFHEAWPSLHRLLLERNDLDVFASINLPAVAKRFDCWQFASLLSTGRTRSIAVHKKSVDEVVSAASKTTNPSFPYSERQQSQYTPTYYRGVLLQHYWNSDAYEAMQRHEKERTGPPYDVVVRVRPDVMYLNPDLPGLDLDALHSYATQKHGARYSYVPDSNEFGGITDAFAVVSRPCSDAYFRILHDMEHYITKEHISFHPETLMKHALLTKGQCKLVLLEDALQHFHGGQSAERKPFDYCITRKGRCDTRPAPLPALSCSYPTEHGDWEGWTSGK
jgi:hypothetical protein